MESKVTKIRHLIMKTKILLNTEGVEEAVEFFEDYRCEHDIELRICYETGQIMIDGICVEGGEAYYASWESFYKNYPDYGEITDDDDTYYTEWEEDVDEVNEVWNILFGTDIPNSPASREE